MGLGKIIKSIYDSLIRIDEPSCQKEEKPNYEGNDIYGYRGDECPSCMGAGSFYDGLPCGMCRGSGRY